MSPSRARHARRRRAEAAGPSPAPPRRRRVVDRGQHAVDTLVVADEVHAGAVVGAAEHEPPASQPLGLGHPTRAVRRRVGHTGHVGPTTHDGYDGYDGVTHDDSPQQLLEPGDDGGDADRIEIPAERGSRAQLALAGDQLSEPASLGHLEPAERPPQQRHDVGERPFGQRRHPLIEDPEEPVVVEQHRAGAGEDPLDERGAIGGGDTAGERPRQASLGLGAVDPLGVEQQPHGAATHDPVRAWLVGDPVEHRRPLVVACGVIEQRERALHGEQAIGGGVSGVVVERRQARGQPDADPPDEPVDDFGQRADVGGAHVAVAQRPGERSERVDQLLDAGRRGHPPRQPLGQDGYDGGQVGEQGGFEQRGDVGHAEPRFGRSLREARRCGGFHRGAVGARFDQADVELRLPAQIATSRGTCRCCSGSALACPTAPRGPTGGGADGSGQGRAAGGDRARAPSRARPASSASTAGGQADRAPVGPSVSRAGPRRSRRRPRDGHGSARAGRRARRRQWPSAASVSSSRPGRGRLRSTATPSASRTAAMRSSGDTPTS